MPYVERDQGGAIIGVFSRPQPGSAEEDLADNHPDVVAFNAADAVLSAKPGNLETLMEMLRQGDPAWEAKLAAARQRIIDRRP